MLNYGSPLAVVLLKAQVVFGYKALEVVKEDRIEGSLFRVSGSVDHLRLVRILLPHRGQQYQESSLEPEL